MGLLGALTPVGISFCRLVSHNAKNVLRMDTNQYFANKRFNIVARSMSSNGIVNNIDISQLQKFQTDPTATIVDVREISEIQETGKLPGSTHIPLGDVKAALQQDPDKFKATYSIPKPPLEQPLVFSCRSGRRSLQAAECAVSLGYKDVYNYKGGWLDWEEHFPKQ